MTNEARQTICKTCINRKLDVKLGFICSLTNKMADFESTCPDYKIDDAITQREQTKKAEKIIAARGRGKTLSVFRLLIGLSLFFNILSFLTFRPFNAFEIIRMLIRFGLEVGLFYAVFIGQKWAKKVLTILYIVGLIICFFSIISFMGRASIMSILFLLTICIYGYGVYFLTTDKDFLGFFEYQKKNA